MDDEIRTLLAEAEAADRQGRPEAAFALLRRARLEDPSDEEAASTIDLMIARSPALRSLSEAAHRQEQVGLAAGITLFSEGRFEEALAVFSELSANAASILGPHLMFSLQCLYKLGRSAELAALAQAAEDFAFENARLADDGKPALMPAPAPYMHSQIGEMCTRFDLLLKGLALGLLPSFTPLLVVDLDGKIANPALLDYFAERVPVHVLPKGQARAFQRRFESRQIYLDFLRRPGLGWAQLIPAWSHVNRLWQEAGHPPLLRLRDHHREAGTQRLRALGVPEGAWFVALHVRQATTYGESEGHFSAARNAEIATYEAALAEITGRGGWVLRLGDPSMPPLPDWPGVIDYARSPLRCDWMDLFLCAESRFVIGMASGISQLPALFGTPLVLVNGFATGPFPVVPGNIYIHKLIASRTSGALLPIRTAFSPPLLQQYHPAFFEGQNLEVRDNTPDEIRHAVLEMIESVEGRLTYGALDEARWSAYRKAADYYGFGLEGRIGKSFLAQHEGLISEPRIG